MFQKQCRQLVETFDLEPSMQLLSVCKSVPPSHRKFIGEVNTFDFLNRV